MPGISPSTVAYLKTLRTATAQFTGSIDAYLAGLAAGTETRSEYVYLGDLLTRGAQANADSMRKPPAGHPGMGGGQPGDPSPHPALACSLRW